MIYRKLIRHGNCRAITLPKTLCEHLELDLGSQLALRVDDRGQIVIRKVVGYIVGGDSTELVEYD